MVSKRSCRAQTRHGLPCRAWAMRGSKPPRCAAHRAPAAAAAGETAAPATCFYSDDPTAITIDAAIAGLADKMRRLDDLIARGDEASRSTWPPDEALLQLYNLYTQASSRLSRLLRDRRALSGEAADGIAAAIAQTLDELSTEWGVTL